MRGIGETDRRPWGEYTVLAVDGDFKIKRIVVEPARRLSLQRHRKRSEHWFILRGKARVTRDEREILLEAGDSVDIPRDAWHRIENTGGEPLVFIEIQTGQSFEEEDIERKEDDFGRS
ncbi:MAG TPA: phosphomannose isomerase type II C-terminal cupin domain [Syntrophales bacterium]|nr:phosphomannose isomerase type II C-terminal cupin domain [Syntrophales bacterium]